MYIRMVFNFRLFDFNFKVIAEFFADKMFSNAEERM